MSVLESKKNLSLATVVHILSGVAQGMMYLHTINNSNNSSSSSNNSNNSNSENNDTIYYELTPYKYVIE